jgi:hypothetical protein
LIRVGSRRSITNGEQHRYWQYKAAWTDALVAVGFFIVLGATWKEMALLALRGQNNDLWASEQLGDGPCSSDVRSPDTVINEASYEMDIV